MTLTVVLPDGVLYRQAASENHARVNVDGQNIGFEPIQQMIAGEKLDFEVPIHAARAGELIIHAEVTSQSQTRPLPADASIKVFTE